MRKSIEAKVLTLTPQTAAAAVNWESRASAAAGPPALTPEDGAVPGIAFQPQSIGSTGKSDAAHQPDQRLKDLGEGGGDHIALSLIVSPVNRNHTTAEDRRGNGKNCRRSAGISSKISEELSEGKDSHSAQDTGDAHQSQGCPEGTAASAKRPVATASDTILDTATGIPATARERTGLKKS